jgi:hypothetical protein
MRRRLSQPLIFSFSSPQDGDARGSTHRGQVMPV